MIPQLKSPGDISSFGGHDRSSPASDVDSPPSSASASASTSPSSSLVPFYNCGGDPTARAPLRMNLDETTPTPLLEYETNMQTSAAGSRAGRAELDPRHPADQNTSPNWSSQTRRRVALNPTGTERAEVGSKLESLMASSRDDLPSLPKSLQKGSPAVGVLSCACASVHVQNTPPLVRLASAESARERADSGVSNVDSSLRFQCAICKKNILPGEGWRSRSSTCSSTDELWSASMDDNSPRLQHLARTETITASGDHTRGSPLACQAPVRVGSDRPPEQLSFDGVCQFEDSTNDLPRAGFERTLSRTESAYGSLQRNLTFKPQYICDWCRRRMSATSFARSDSIESPKAESSDWCHVERNDLPPDDQINNSRDNVAQTLYQYAKNAVVSYLPTWRS